jgi:hypothetical protein
MGEVWHGKLYLGTTKEQDAICHVMSDASELCVPGADFFRSPSFLLSDGLLLL